MILPPVWAITCHLQNLAVEFRPCHLEGRWITDLESPSSQAGQPGRECRRLGQGNTGKGTALPREGVPYGEAEASSSEGLGGNLSQIQLVMDTTASRAPLEWRKRPPWLRECCRGLHAGVRIRRGEQGTGERPCHGGESAKPPVWPQGWPERGRQGGLHSGSAGYIEAPGLAAILLYPGGRSA